MKKIIKIPIVFDVLNTLKLRYHVKAKYDKHSLIFCKNIHPVFNRGRLLLWACAVVLEQSQKPRERDALY